MAKPDKVLFLTGGEDDERVDPKPAPVEKPAPAPARAPVLAPAAAVLEPQPASELEPSRSQPGPAPEING